MPAHPQGATCRVRTPVHLWGHALGKQLGLTEELTDLGSPEGRTF